MDYQPYFHGFLLSTTALAIEHLCLFAWLGTKGDAGVLAKFMIGVGAILLGCALVRWEQPASDPLLTPLVCSSAGLVIILAYVGRWIAERMKDAAYTRGRLHGLADKGDIHEDG